jgi:protease-4
MVGRRLIAIILVSFCAATSVLAETPTTGPAAAPATAPALAEKKSPTPPELIEQMKQIRAQDATKTKIAYIDLSGSITEKPAGFSIFGGNDTHTLRDLVVRLNKARDDKAISAVLITIGADTQLNLAQAQEIRDALLDLRRLGKKTFVYADSYDTDSYTLASGATNICLPEGGEILMPGVGLETMFYKGTFDKIGVAADYVQIGEYKGAEEPYTRTAPSDELKTELTHLTESLFGQIVDGISLSRNLSTQSVRQAIDDAMMTARVAKEKGFVDHLVEQDGLRGLLKEEMSNEIDLIARYGETEREEMDFSNPFSLLASLNRRPEASDKPAVAVIYADGVISDGGGAEDDLFSDGGVTSDRMRRDLRIAARDEKIKAIILRIDSPGGSALASEVIWQAIRRVSNETKKPIVISVGSMAASGGYYLASAGDYVFADRAAIVGSIGVVGGKFVLKDLFDKLGLTTEEFTQGRNADLFSSNQRFSDRQRRMMRTWMQQTYDQFTQRVMTTRKDKIQDIDKVARGRIFLAVQARDLGLVDELGGCDKAIEYAANKAGLAPGSYEVRSLPAPRTLAEILSGRAGDETLTPLRPGVTVSPEAALLSLAPADARGLVKQQLQMIHLLQRRPVVLMMPFVASVK